MQLSGSLPSQLDALSVEMEPSSLEHLPSMLWPLVKIANSVQMSLIAPGPHWKASLLNLPILNYPMVHSKQVSRINPET